MPLERAIISLNNLGLTDVLLPFALIFTIIYAVGGQIPQLDQNSRFKTILALVVSLLVVVPHVTNQYPRGLDVVEIINNSIPQVALVIVAVILAIMLLGATTRKEKEMDFAFKGIKWIALGLVVLIFLDNINYGMIGRVPLLSWLSDPDVQAIVVIVVVFFLIFWYITGGSGAGKIPYNNRHFDSKGQLRRYLIDTEGLDREEADKIVKGIDNSANS